MSAPALHPPPVFGLTRALAVTPSNSVDDPSGPFDGVLVTVAGNVSCLTSSGDTIAVTAAAAGTVLPVSITRVNSTGTSASLLGLRR
ncbi:MAG TPA: hypothetical protein VGM56_20975 [Byssovorax sp.]|jgi:hypothetical protein